MTSSYHTTVHRNYIQVNAYGNKTYHGRLKDGITHHTLHKVFKTATMAEKYAWAVRDRLEKLRKAQYIPPTDDEIAELADDLGVLDVLTVAVEKSTE